MGRTISLKKETYSANGNKHIKRKHNDIFCKKMGRISKALILDSSKNNTGRLLKLMGMKKNNIHSPNNKPSVIEDQLKNGIVTPILSTMNAFIKKTLTTYDGAWLDYCGTYNTEKNGVNDFFKRKLLVEKNGVFAVTFSMRGGHGNLQKRKEKITREILTMGKKNGYDLCNTRSDFYGKKRGAFEMEFGVKNCSSMLFLLFEN